MSSLSREVSQHFNQVHVAGHSHLCSLIYFPSPPFYFAFAQILMLLLVVFPSAHFTTIASQVINDVVFLLTLKQGL